MYVLTIAGRKSCRSSWNGDYFRTEDFNERILNYMECRTLKQKSRKYLNYVTFIRPSVLLLLFLPICSPKSFHRCSYQCIKTEIKHSVPHRKELKTSLLDEIVLYCFLYESTNRVGRFRVGRLWPTISDYNKILAIVNSTCRTLLK